MEMLAMHNAQRQERDSGLSQLAAGPGEVVAASGISLRMWRLYALAWLVCLVFPILSLIQTPIDREHRAAAAAGLAIFALTYAWFMWPHPATPATPTRPGSRASLMILAGLLALVLGLSRVYGGAFLWLFVGVSAIVGVALPARAAFIAVMALTLLTLGAGVAIHGGLTQTDWFHLLPLVLLVRGLGLDMVGLIRLSDALRELHAARGALARRAVTEERLRLARDLHDLLGQTLSMITLKSELARRLVEKDPARAAQEMHEVERAARQALREAREAVAGYRQPSLQSELEGARQLFEAAGIKCYVQTISPVLPAAVDSVLAWVVREGVTNVIRHSQAELCIIRTNSFRGNAWAEVINDGYREQDARLDPMGSGLSGLSERLAAHGGHMEAGPTIANGRLVFRLRAELPLRDDDRVGRTGQP
jgi:two-component system, NarL family, sensor histidine kinase DesK